MSLVAEIPSAHTPETLAERFRATPGRVVLRSGCFELPQARISLVAAEPFLTFSSLGSRCEVRWRGSAPEVHYGDPWRLLEALLARYELPDQPDVPFPLGGAFGYWGYDLGRFLEARLGPPPSRSAVPDCWVGFFSSLVAFDHREGRTFVIATGLQPDGTRQSSAAREELEAWRRHLGEPHGDTCAAAPSMQRQGGPAAPGAGAGRVVSNFTREAFCAAVLRAQEFIRSGDIYQVNLAQRFTAHLPEDPWSHWLRLTAASPAPFAAFLDAGEFQLASISPELFLRLNGTQIQTRPIKGTRPRSIDPDTDARLTYELQTSPKEIAELVMITDLLRNDLGKVCEFGSVRVPSLLRLERFAHVQHLVSTVEGRLLPGITHLDALKACFPGGSITGAPKLRAMQIIDQLEPDGRGPYTGCAGYLGFNRESQLSILIRTSVIHRGVACYHAGAGIVADSDPAAEYEETLAKAAAFLRGATTEAPSRSGTTVPEAFPGLTADRGAAAP